jgi:hypothetical protein
MDPMSSISSISALPPVKPPDNSTPPKTPDPQNDSDSDDTTAQPPVQAALPPGQGTRIDQLV